MVKYCSSCGHKNLYSLKVPNFCGGCGKALEGGFTSKAKVMTPFKGKSKGEEGEFDPDGLDIFKVPRLSKLVYTIAADPKNKFTLKDIDQTEGGESLEITDGNPTKE